MRLLPKIRMWMSVYVCGEILEGRFPICIYVLYMYDLPPNEGAGDLGVY